MNRFIGIILLGIVLLQSCAEQRPLSGGPKDSLPPIIDPMKYSTENYQTNFDKNEVVLTFNEWVVLRNAYSQVLVSPPMEERPRVEVRHKSVVLKFKEELRENTTYSIQFGDAVVDYTEGNPAKNLRFVFSTGNYIDSLKLDGEIVDAETGKGKVDVWVMLYDNLADSVPRTERPFYVAKTDKQGKFQFENIRKDSFKVFALDDQNANYLYDQPTEAIAFHPEPIWLSDSTQGKLRLRMFKELEPLRLNKTKLEGRGSAVVEFNQKLQEKIKVALINQNVDDFFFIQEEMSLKLWWKSENSSETLNWDLELIQSSFKDTAKVDQLKDLEYPKIAFAEEKQADRESGKGGNLAKNKKTKQEKLKVQADKSLKLSFQHPINDWDSSKIEFWADSVQITKLEIEKDSSDPRVLKIVLPQIGTNSNKLLLLPDALTDYWGQGNRDSLKQDLKPLTEDDLGNVEVKVINADSSKNYLLQLLNKEEEVLDEVRFFGQDSLVRSYNNLEATQYFLQVILDKDANGRWSNGDYSQGKQPEFVIRSKPISLRAGWDNEMEIDVSEDLLEAKKPSVLGNGAKDKLKVNEPDEGSDNKQRGG